MAILGCYPLNKPPNTTNTMEISNQQMFREFSIDPLGPRVQSHTTVAVGWVKIQLQSDQNTLGIMDVWMFVLDVL